MKRHVAQKCTFCEHRTAQGLAPAYADACPTRCRIFGDLDDSNGEIGRKVRDNPTTVWKPEAGTKPRVIYIDPARALQHLADDGVQVDTRAMTPGDSGSGQGQYTPPEGLPR
jgi:Fe-S-cluster-containing dehydrogenase component